MAFSPDGTELASTSADRTVRLWDTATGKQIGQPLIGHTDAALGVAFSPDGTKLASASADGTVRLWDTATGAPLGQPLIGHAYRVWGVAFSPDGTKFASAGADTTVRLWPLRLDDWMALACERVGRNMTLDEWRSVAHRHALCADCPQYPSGDGRLRMLRWPITV